jgi:demethylmenaquinone methyltransferase/2-methoxy-6-polyprenyl-1,4-benzoquinol methylase
MVGTEPLAANPGSPLGSPGDLDSTARAVRELFAAIAPRYDLLNRLLTGGTDIAWRKLTARSVRDLLARPGSAALDVCCGTGDLTLALTRYSRGRVFGADFCHPMLKLARTKVRQAAQGSRTNSVGATQVTFFEADSLVLPLAVDSLDVVTTAFGFRNLASYARGLNEILRVLKPGGRLAILECSRLGWPLIGPLFRLYFNRIVPVLGRTISGVRGAYRYLPDSVAGFPDQEALARLMREAGFVNVTYRNFCGGVAALHLGTKPWIVQR